MMKIHFIYADVNTLFYNGVHHGIASISSVLKENGHSVSLHYIKKEPSKNNILDRIREESPDLIAFSVVTNQVNRIKIWSNWIKQEMDIPIICGGIHATLFPEEIIGFDGVDIVCIGEGEYPLLDLANNPERTDIKNLWIKHGNEIIKNPLRALIDPLDSLPFPDYELFDIMTILKDRDGDFSLIASRGCPFNCSYCCNHALRNVQSGIGNYVRAQSVDYILREIGSLLARFPVTHLTFADDILGFQKAWTYEFCEKYSKQYSLEFECNARVEMVDENLIKVLKTAKCTKVNMGIESGNEWLRKNILHRNMSNEQIINAFDIAHKYGIRTLSYNMIGLPYETPEMVLETINLNKRAEPDQLAISFFYPYPGTELYELCRREGFLSNKVASNFLTDSILENLLISKNELKKLYIKFYKYSLQRRIHSFPFFIRIFIKFAFFTLLTLFGKDGVEIMIKIYIRFFRLFAILQNKTNKGVE
ncbi:B12-binding domain-containing radical SAM protein [Chloroflexota bacterium]